MAGAGSSAHGHHHHHVPGVAQAEALAKALGIPTPSAMAQLRQAAAAAAAIQARSGGANGVVVANGAGGAAGGAASGNGAANLNQNGVNVVSAASLKAVDAAATAAAAAAASGALEGHVPHLICKSSANYLRAKAPSPAFPFPGAVVKRSRIPRSAISVRRINRRQHAAESFRMACTSFTSDVGGGTAAALAFDCVLLIVEVAAAPPNPIMRPDDIHPAQSHAKLSPRSLLHDMSTCAAASFHSSAFEIEFFMSTRHDTLRHAPHTLSLTPATATPLRLWK